MIVIWLGNNRRWWIEMNSSYLLDYGVKRAKGLLHVHASLGANKDYFSKYHELYDKGQFDQENRKHFLEEWFTRSVGYFPNIDHPKTLNEKLQWYKLYYKNPLMPKCIDKISFKDFIKDELGSEYAIPLIGVYPSAAEIDFDALPKQFVIKLSCGSDAKQIILVEDKSKLDISATRAAVAGWEKPWWRAAWGGYEFIEPRILIEEYVEQAPGQVYDYKIACYGGNPDYIIFSTGRFTSQTLDFFDPDWKLLDITSKKHPHSPMKIERPPRLSEMLEISRKLSRHFPFVRVDFYEPDERMYVGELTFYPGGGMNKSSSVKRDYESGEKFILPAKSN